jgi:hypothetical protein
MFEAIRWPDHMRPSRNPIHFTNELESNVSPGAIWSTLTDVALWPAFYPNVSNVRLLEGASTLELGTRFQAGLAGLDVIATVEEFEPFERIAWYGGPKEHPDATAYHAFIFTRTATGTHMWTEEVMRGDLWIQIAKAAPDRFWLDHEKLLRDLSQQARLRAGLG